MASSYENLPEIIEEVGRRAGKPFETLTAGALGVGSAKWP
jgi:hypothetical protein